MLNFKIVKTTQGQKLVVNLERIDSILYTLTREAAIRIGGEDFRVSLETAQLLEKALGAEA